MDPTFYRVVTAHHVFNFTKRVVVTPGYKSSLCTAMNVSIFSQRSNTGLLKPDWNPTVFSVRACSMQLPRPACRTWFVATARLFPVARLLRVEVRHAPLATLHCASVLFPHERKRASTIVSRCSRGHGFRNQKRDRFKRRSGCEDVRALLLCLVAFSNLLRQAATNVRRSFVPFASKHLVLITLCPPPSYCEHAEGSSDSVHTTLGEADASIRVPVFLCVSAVLETGGLPPDWLPLLQPRLLRMLAPCHLDSQVDPLLADIRMVLLPEKIHWCHINIVFIRRQTEDLRSLSASCRCRRNPTVEKRGHLSLHAKRSIHPCVCEICHFVLAWNP